MGEGTKGVREGVKGEVCDIGIKGVGEGVKILGEFCVIGLGEGIKGVGERIVVLAFDEREEDDSEGVKGFEEGIKGVGERIVFDEREEDKTGLVGLVGVIVVGGYLFICSCNSPRLPNGSELLVFLLLLLFMVFIGCFLVSRPAKRFPELCCCVGEIGITLAGAVIEGA